MLRDPKSQDTFKKRCFNDKRRDMSSTKCVRETLLPTVSDRKLNASAMKLSPQRIDLRFIVLNDALDGVEIP